MCRSSDCISQKSRNGASSLIAFPCAIADTIVPNGGKVGLSLSYWGAPSHMGDLKRYCSYWLYPCSANWDVLPRTGLQARRQGGVTPDTVPVPSSSVAIKGHGEAQNVRDRKYSFRGLLNGEQTQCREVGFAIDGLEKSLLRDSYDQKLSPVGLPQARFPLEAFSRTKRSATSDMEE